ncbi:hypothetical protein WMY93_022091 [Mugilogobius chulae]|uniref:Uncharacterized protein n=1 Tax=Mugilogobius chulae TaxID=88201 RepID=A0AAW0NGW1_9GOBI
MAKIRVSYEYSEAEDKSIRLGLFLIACGILSLFILGFCWLSPTLQSLQSKPPTARPDDVLWRRSHDTSVLLHCVLWPMVSLLLGALIVLLTVCARSLAVRAEALQKRKCSYEVCQDVGPCASDQSKAVDPLTSTSDPHLSSPSRTLPLFAVPVRRRDREH